MDVYTTRRLQRLFGTEITPAAIRKAEASGHIPKATRDMGGKQKRKWKVADLPAGKLLAVQPLFNVISGAAA